jgi:GTP-binding protein
MDGHPVTIFSAEFLTTAVEPAGWPEPKGPEVAFAGRSNVGKSSMINALARRKKLVRVSNTPGRTRTLNFFEVALEDEAGARRVLTLCDLPGYGFAKASKAERALWRTMIENYVHGREGLCAVVCIVDANVGPTEDDLRVIPWVLAAGRRVLVAATKMDRVPKHRRAPRAHEIERALTLAEGDVIGVSATQNLNLDLLWRRILEACPSGPAAPPSGTIKGR